MWFDISFDWFLHPDSKEIHMLRENFTLVQANVVAPDNKMMTVKISICIINVFGWNIKHIKAAGIA